MRIDVAGDGWTPAIEYAKKLVVGAEHDFDSLLESLADYDQAVASLAAREWQKVESPLRLPEVQGSLKGAASFVREAFRIYLESERASLDARIATQLD